MMKNARVIVLLASFCCFGYSAHAESPSACLSTDPIGTWSGIIVYSNNPNVSNGTIPYWILRCDGTTDGTWRVYYWDGSVLSFNPSGNYIYSACQLQFSCSGTASFQTPNSIVDTTSYTLDVTGTIGGDTAAGSYEIDFDDEDWPDDRGTWQVSRAIGTDLSDLEMLAANWLEVTCDCSNEWCDGVDFDYSSTIDFMDFCVLAQHWLQEN
jgi:hypothetical protein